MITDEADIHDLTHSSPGQRGRRPRDRPGHNYSYTNNWPAEQRVDNGPTAS